MPRSPRRASGKGSSGDWDERRRRLSFPYSVNRMLEKAIRRMRNDVPGLRTAAYVVEYPL